MMAKYTVGQTICLAERGHYGAKEWKCCNATVTSVGRKWVNFGKTSRANIETGRVDGLGYHTEDRIFPSEEAFRTWHAANQVWSRFTLAVSRAHYTYPLDLTAFDIERAAAILRLELVEGTPR